MSGSVAGNYNHRNKIHATILKNFTILNAGLVKLMFVKFDFQNVIAYKQLCC